MDLAKGLVQRLVDDDRLNEIKRAGITHIWLDDENAQILTYIQRHYAEYKKVPSREAVRSVFPSYQFTSYVEPIEFFINQLQEGRRRTLLEAALLEINRTYEKDTKKAESLIRDALGVLSKTGRSFKDTNLAESAEERLGAYDERKNNPGANGILSGWNKIDYQTLGWQSEEFVVLVGEKYRGKSWLMLWLAYKAFLQGERVLFATKEMSKDAMARRFDSIYASVKYDSLRRGELSNVEEQRYRDRLSNFGTTRGEGSIVLVRDGITSIADIESKAVETDATIAFADSVYLFNAEPGDRSGSETQRRMAVSQRCKLAAQNLGIPFIVSTQAGRPKSKGPITMSEMLDQIEWSNAFSQDAETVMMIEKDEIDKELNRMKLYLLKSRDGNTALTTVHTDFEYMTFEEDENDSQPTTEITIEDDSNDRAESMFA